MPNSSQKGSRRERELVNRLDDMGWVVLRAPASGSATTREMPDVVAGDGNLIIAGEAKTGDPDNIVYIDAKKVKGLKFVAEGFGGHAIAFVRWDQDTTWYWKPVDDIPLTPSGHLSIKAWETGTWYTLDELAGRLA